LGKTAVGIEYATSERFVSADRLGAAAAAALAARATTARRSTERRKIPDPPFSIDLVEFAKANDRYKSMSTENRTTKGPLRGPSMVLSSALIGY
jgi:hypothetical protein